MSSDEKVLDAEHIDRVRSVSDSDDSYGFSPAEQKSIVRRIDRRLVVTVGAMYCISLMDRTNMGAAVIAGMDKELQLIGTRYVRLKPPLNSIALFWLTCFGRILPTSSSSSHTSSSSRPRPSSAAPSAPAFTSPSSPSSGAPSQFPWASSRTSMLLQACERFSVSLRPVSSPAASTSSAPGTRDVREHLPLPQQCCRSY